MSAGDKSQSSRRPWTLEDLALLTALYPDQTGAVVCAALGRSIGSTYRKASFLGLAKSDAFNASERTGRIQRGCKDPHMTASHFKPGHVAWNKGKPGSTGLHAACRATQFKPGQSPITTLPVGGYRLCDGWLQKKTSETPGPNHKRWTPVTRLVWEAANGPVSKGHLVVFKPGCATNVLERITPDVVECISRAEHARRNHPRNKSPELAKLVQLKGAITRQVNRITREHKERQTA